MEKEFVPYSLALRMKQLGFDEPCFAYYNYYIKGVPLNLYGSDYNGTGQPAPTWNSAFRWFREKYKMKFHIKEDRWNHWCAPLILIPETRDFEELCDWFETYEEAELACLEKLIEIVEGIES